MLSSAIKYRDAFERLGFEDRGFEKEMGGLNIPTESDWDRAKLFVGFLEHFYNLTVCYSGSSYVTSNTSFHEISDTYIILSDWGKSGDRELQKMAKAMKEKYDKYWENVTKMNMLLYIPVVLDPRYKLEFVTFALEDMYSGGNGDGISELERAAHMNECDIFDDLEPQASSKATGLEIAERVKRAMEDLFNEYKKKFSVQESETSSSSSMSSQVTNTMESQNTNVLADKYKRRQTGGVIREKSKLEKYLNEDVEDIDDKKFDILGWWKINSAKFPTLAHIARDVLSIPVSTVASEFAFSAGGRILDSFRSSLSPNMVEALICSQDWIRVKNQVVVEEDNDFVDNLESDMSSMRLANA